MSVLRAGAHECHIHSAPVLVLPRIQRFSIPLKRRQTAFPNGKGYLRDIFSFFLFLKIKSKNHGT
ncbi:hypothetical protein DAD80_03475 [Bacillus altitudinis]|nr:hypothetical protein BS467_14100 [Bacillus altitudinis]PUF91178.1 hypothetical protein DAD80_03475 [Bacillus altitudinis]PWN85323.1 hypothetical protein CTM99_05890 [Bacillus altitudinis]QAR54503.1 hypothetical protein BAE_17410 [Bacillus aerophilus]RFB45009.1 hypothetical protein DZB74_10570 [Bacillus sp. HMG]